MKNDLLDQLLDDWQREEPGIEVGAMAVVGRILHLGKILEKRAADILKLHELQYSEFDVLATLRRQGKPYRLTPTQLRQSVLITSGAMTTLLSRLEKKGLLERVESQSDGRSRLVVLTGPGRQLVDNVVQLRFAEAENAIAGLASRERHSLAKLLKKMVLSLPPADLQ